MLERPVPNSLKGNSPALRPAHENDRVELNRAIAEETSWFSFSTSSRQQYLGKEEGKGEEEDGVRRRREALVILIEFLRLFEQGTTVRASLHTRGRVEFQRRGPVGWSKSLYSSVNSGARLLEEEEAERDESRPHVRGGARSIFYLLGGGSQKWIKACMMNLYRNDAHVRRQTTSLRVRLNQLLLDVTQAFISLRLLSGIRSCPSFFPLLSPSVRGCLCRHTCVYT